MKHWENGHRSRWVRALAALACAVGLAARTDAQIAADYAVQVSVTLRDDPPAIVLAWPEGPTQRSDDYAVFRRAPSAPSWGEPIATAVATHDDGRRSFTDEAVEPGKVYEYKVEKRLGAKTDAGEHHLAFGYVLAAIRAPLVEQRGAIVLVVDHTIAEPLAPEIARLQNDLIGDGWRVVRHEVARDESVAAVKARIKQAHEADPRGVQAALLLGRVPVPYSGNFSPLPPDGHALPGDDHRGAWPADVFYADMDGEWTDHTEDFVNDSNPRGTNVPGDGKLDPSYLPSDVELQIGRVDLSSLPGRDARRAYPDELAGLKRYLDKDHAFRHARTAVRRKALIGEPYDANGGRAYAASGYRSFAPLFGSDHLVIAGTQLATPAAERWLKRLTADSYLWVFGGGGGGNRSISTLGFRGDYHDVWAVDLVDEGARGVFHLFFGSWLGDWDQPDNIMRTALLTEHGLAAAWSGRPHLVFHPMGLGETLGFCIRASQNNDTTYRNQINTFRRGVHIALLGDPTLRLHPVPPPAEVQAAVREDGIVVSWQRCPGDVLGYHVYRAASPTEPFARLTEALVEGTEFLDAGRGADGSLYMVRAVTLEVSGSGSYFNASQGVFARVE